MRKLLAVSLLLLSCKCFSQVEPAPQVWMQLENDIWQKKDLELNWERLEKIKRDADNQNDAVTLARSLYNIMMIKDLKTEDSLYFHNSLFIDSILQSQTRPELSLLMHYLQAQRIARFQKKGLKFNRARYETRPPGINYASLSFEQLDSTANLHFEMAKKLWSKLDPAFRSQSLTTEKVLWLSSYPLTFLFKPNLFDIICNEQIELAGRTDSWRTLSKSIPETWLSLPHQTFVDTIKQFVTINHDIKSIPLYLEWMAAQHADPAKYQFIESLLREFVLHRADPYQTFNYENEYAKYLSPLTSSSYKELKAKAVYELCLLWYKWSGRFNNNRFDAISYYVQLDSTFRQYAAMALELYSRNSELFSDYGFLQNKLERMKGSILAKDLSMSLKDVNQIDKAILIKLEYRNVPSLHYRILRLKFPYLIEGININRDFVRSQSWSDEVVVNLPLPADYNQHATLLKIPPLPSGHYCIVYSYASVDSGSNLGTQSFSVTNMATLASDDRMYVVNSTTGMPIENAVINEVKLKTGKISSSGVRTQANGFVNFPPQSSRDLITSYQGDTLQSTISGASGADEVDVYDKEEYDDLVEFYDDNTTAMVFTDRGIYRPGQKVFFKVILTTKNPRTGELMIMNAANLKKGFHNYLKKWIERESPLLYLMDPFGRVVDSIKISPDSYGSVAGSFILPKNASTGDWSIEPDYLETDDRNPGEFKVEEYRRPSFELTVDKPWENYKIGDSLRFRVRLKAFSGSTLGHTLVKYQITRSDRRFNSGAELVNIDSSIYTDENGFAEIVLFDSSLSEVDKTSQLQWAYYLNAQATDVAGETHEANASLSVSTKPIRINIPPFKAIDLAQPRSLLINAYDINNVPILQTLHIQLFEMPQPEDRGNELAVFGDQWLYSRDSLQKWFPDYEFALDTSSKKEELVYETSINSADFEKFKWPVGKLHAGHYRLRVAAYENKFLAGESSRTFTSFDSRSRELPSGDGDFSYIKANLYQPGDTLRWFTGSKYDSVYVIRQLKYFSQKKKKQLVLNYYHGRRTKGIHEWEWKIPQDALDNAVLSEIYVINNQLHKHEERISIAASEGDHPEFIIERFRSRLHPGDSATFSLVIKTKNANVAAQLMTTIYDASLDRLAEHKWKIPTTPWRPGLIAEWPSSIWSMQHSEMLLTQSPAIFQNPRPVWWMDSTQLSYFSSPELFISSNFLQGRVAGLDVDSYSNLNEVVVFGFASRRQELTGSVASIQVRGITSLSAFQQPLTILDGVVFTGDLSSISAGDITELLVLKGVEASAIYGSRGANGVLIISTKGPIVLAPLKEEPIVKIRSNFNATAFFAPSIHAGKDGYYTFSFTMPQSVTEWNWKLFASTKAADFIYAEKKLLTQLPLMVQPHLPLSLYQGDRVVLKSRISNLDTLTTTGTVACKVEDAVTGEELKGLIAESAHEFAINEKSTVYSSFQLVVPETQLHPLKITITAKTSDFADGEEYIIPVLSKKILVKANQTIQMAKADTLVLQPQLSSDALLYGVELSIQPKPQTALLNSLPYLAHYSFDCAEQLFNKLFAYATAVTLVRKDPELQHPETPIESEVTKSSDHHPDSVVADAMPWLLLSNKERLEHEQLLELLDTMKSNTKIELYLEKIIALQNVDGGIAWFDGGRSNPYISTYLLAGFGRLKDLGWNALTQSRRKPARWSLFLNKLITYTDQLLLNETADVNSLIWNAYAKSYWTSQLPISESLHSRIEWILDSNWNHSGSLQAKALWAICCLRYFGNDSEMHSKAMSLLTSLKQSAIIDQKGMRWKEIADADDLQTSAEETIDLLAEAFEEGKLEGQITDALTRWLLTYKYEQQWHTTKGTGAVIDLLMKSNGTALGKPNEISATLDKTTLDVSDDVRSGHTSAFHKASQVPSMRVEKKGNEPINANIGWYYFAAPETLAGLNTSVKIHKRWYHLDETTKAWELADSTMNFKIGEKVRIVLEFETEKALRYVWIRDNRSAALEPTEYNSGYKYGREFSYYQSVRDVSTDFFAEFIPSGRTEIAYEMIIAQEGNFSGGVAMLQCMYQPALTSYSNTAILNSKNEVSPRLR